MCCVCSHYIVNSTKRSWTFSSDIQKLLLNSAKRAVHVIVEQVKFNKIFIVSLSVNLLM